MRTTLESLFFSNMPGKWEGGANSEDAMSRVRLDFVFLQPLSTQLAESCSSLSAPYRGRQRSTRYRARVRFLVHAIAGSCALVTRTVHTEQQDLRNVNDSSANLSTETLLRLLFFLNDQVLSSSRQHRQCRRIAAHQSENLTKSFNR
ncbi:hypothetical protein PUN28_017807 [Cardiocondyla obscurior]|uniref:Uncharacterized protein n=1 Tax=Cardiocondyla obscurior TaxID=286306 RepID=A0AAW2ENY4_9HYME